MFRDWLLITYGLLILIPGIPLLLFYVFYYVFRE